MPPKPAPPPGTKPIDVSLKPGSCKSDATASKGHILPLDEVERIYLERAVSGFKGDRGELAAKLGISPRTLYRKLEKIKS